MTSCRSLLPAVALAASAACHKPDPRVGVCRDELSALAMAVRVSHDQLGRWPPSLVAAAGKGCPPEHTDCLSQGGARLDPWQRAYEYDQSAKGVLLRSAGPDGQLGTGDDLDLAVGETPKP